MTKKAVNILVIVCGILLPILGNTGFYLFVKTGTEYYGVLGSLLNISTVIYLWLVYRHSVKKL
ncbi:MAG: hypothetical protein IJN50_06385 [Clostridia bacterium]|nr:hypothetical protein [Clostridiales bacterium]MBQ6992512.1 hypothetical protein [Clostridia bacterium]